MEKPLVTVVTIVYNLVKAGRVETFEECAKSVAGQSYENIEHIIIDGASDDGTLEFLKTLIPEENIFSEKDTGIYNAMNKGIKHAKGKYIAFLNSDDFWNGKDHVKNSVELLEKNGAAFSYSDTNFLYGKKVKRSKAALRKIFYKMPFCHQTMMCNTEILRKEGGFNEKFRGAADYDLMLRLFLKGYKSVHVKSADTSFRVSGWSSENAAQSAHETVLSLAENTGVSVEKCQKMFDTRIIPPEIYEKYFEHLTKTQRLMNFADNFIYGLKEIRGKILSVRLNKEPKVVRIFGHDFIKEEKYVKR